MCNWYKHDIPAWLGGTAHLSHEAYRLYHVVCQLIYMHERPITLNERGLAGAAAMSTRAFRTALKELLDAEKLVQIGHKLSNVRASFELEKVAKSREHSTKSREPSTKSREQAPNLLKTNGTAQVISFVPSPRLEEKRVEENRKKVDTIADAMAPCRSDDFGEFKKLYPKRSGANPWKPAQAKYELAVRRGTAASVINASAKAYAAECIKNGIFGTEKTAQALTWLNQERYRDYENVTITLADELSGSLV